MAASTPTIDPNRTATRRYPVGVEIVPRPGAEPCVHARVWAPDCQTVEFVTEGAPSGGLEVALAAEGNGYHSGVVTHAAAGTRYRFRLDHADAFPDPASRFQPDGPHGPSMIVDAAAYDWRYPDWRGVSIDGQVIYEMHVGTFTADGTLRSAIDRLPALADTGVTIIELMPLADFAGRFGWGYDGVNLFAPCRLYGAPDDLRAFVDAAHGLGLGVILDVVYNHLGPDGNYLSKFARRYFSGHPTDWGDALNFDGADAAPVREFFLTNARYWIEEFRFDGLRLDATQQIFDKTTPNIMAEITTTVREAARGRKTIIVAENEPQDTTLVGDPDTGGYGMDALWNDDFHHAALVAASGRNEAYYSGYNGVSQEFISAAKYGFLYQGQWFTWQEGRRGTAALDLPPTRFVNFIQNHDQLANTAAGRRLQDQTSPGRYRALTALLLLLPQTPMLFQGQEFAASSPFLYFADHGPELAKRVRDGRATFLAQFPSMASAEGAASLEDPADPQTFARCKLDWSERERNTQALALHKDLLRLRRHDPVIGAQRARGVDGAVLTDRAFVLRFFGDEDGDRLLIVNLGMHLHADPIAEPLMAPPPNRAWTTLFSTESPAYGGWGTPDIETTNEGWQLPAECAVLLTPTRPTRAVDARHATTPAR